MKLEFQILGPLSVTRDGIPLDLGTPKARRLLAMLLCEPGRPVSVGALIDGLWGDAPPKTATKNLHLYVHRLRRALGDPGLIRRSEPGYLIAAAGLDSREFEELVRAAESECDPAAAAALLIRALDMWRDDNAYADIGDIPFVGPAARRLGELRLTAVERRAECDLRRGRHAELVPELVALCERYPLRQRLTAHLMLALYRCGRHEEALAAYETLRRTLAEETGLDPADELADLQAAVLARAPSLAAARADASGSESLGRLVERGYTPPRMEPTDIADFTGRGPELATALALLTGRRHADNPVPILAVSGPGGVGKTAFAAHLAHRVAAGYEDGLLYASLAGAGSAPVEPVEVLGRFLRALGVADHTVPGGADERAGLYRSLLAGRRVLVVLDDVAAEARPVPLIPGSGTCAVIVTSRARLGGLPGAHSIDLAALPGPDAGRLLEKIVGAARVRDDPAAARELVRICAGLPLALRIAGARLASRPHWRLADLVGRLADERQRLDVLRHRDLEVRASFSFSYHALRPAARRLFRLLGLLEAPDFTAWTAAAVAGASPADADALLDEIVDARLLDVTGHGPARRHRFHDLVRAYARERSAAEDGAATGTEAVRRALAAMLSLTDAARRSDEGGDDMIIHGVAPRWHPDLLVPGFAGTGPPLDWLRRERPNLTSAVAQAAALGMDELCWELAVAGMPLFHSDCYFDDWQDTHRTALACARAKGNRRGAAMLLLSLAVCAYARRELPTAEEYNARAVELFEAIGDRYGHALALRRSAQIHVSAGRNEAAIAHGRHAHELLYSLDHPVAAADALAQVGVAYLNGGDPVTAVEVLTQVVSAARAVGSHMVEARNSYWLGLAHLEAGDFQAAEGAFAVLGELAGLAGHRTGLLYARHGRGRLHLVRGESRPAREELSIGLAEARELNDPLMQLRILTDLGELSSEAGELARASAELTEAVEIGAGLDHVLWRARPLRRLAEVRAALGDNFVARPGPDRPAATS